jgi:adenylylsulfate kinase
MTVNNIHPISSSLLKSKDKETLLGQKGNVFWMYGLSGSGKSTLAIQVERDLHQSKLHSIILDGDNLRNSLNKDLGFTDKDREENLRRACEVAKMLAVNGLVVIASFITPRRKFRESAREIIGKEFFNEVFVKASYKKCKERDVKGLYAKAEKGEINQFTGKSSGFEEPIAPWLTIETELETPEASAKKLLDAILEKVKP